jgi:hypothetical protein
MTSINFSPQLDSIWKLDLTFVVCPSCNRAFLLSVSKDEQLCPQCLQDNLQPFSAPFRPEPPELVIPIAIKGSELYSRLTVFCAGLWFPPSDFIPQNLLKRAIPVFFPMWLVDATCQGEWQAEAGFEYQVQSSKEYYREGAWQSQSVHETRIKWQTRLGQITRRYQNIAVKAVEDHNKLIGVLGDYSFSNSVPYNPTEINQSFIRSPDILPDQSWPDAEMRLRTLIQQDCQKASNAQHFRNFSSSLNYVDQHWTQILIPAYVTYYNTDNLEKIQVLINAQSGQVFGPKIASQKRGWHTAALMGGIGLGLILFAILLFLFTAIFPPVGLIGSIVLVIGIGLTGIAIIPAVYPWFWNRKQTEFRVFKTN